MASTTFTPNSTVNSTEAQDQAAGTTNLHGPVSDASDSTYTHTQHNSVDAYVWLGLSDLPADAVSTDPVTALDYTFRVRDFGPGGTPDDSIVLYAQIVSGVTALTNQVTVRTHAQGATTTAWADVTGSFTVTGTPSETQWNAAELRFDWTYTKTKGPDPVCIDIAEASIAVTYTAPAVLLVNEATHAHTADNATVAEEANIVLSNPEATQISATSIVPRVDIDYPA